MEQGMPVKELIQFAYEAQSRSYSPYSGFATGAALEADNGRIFLGCNIENAAYSPTNCAERTAIFKAVSEGEREILAIAIYSPNSDNCYPCGACRQVMYEFQGDDEIIVITEDCGRLDARKLSEFLPFGFRI